ncbi:hypothetical protein [Synechococcus sp. CBW1107]|uniref:hypothetical protein n=1 Tax=Synechococcus sp. CBW1107 TaxID=2789857 RepID=UPI002AD2551D|nr:hypothetical protein [Synechococcus sp. CBW1107]CAK6699128.1 hypothetical protein ICNINCKA_02578 [Synechococcus sp. CBW1107]
MVPISLTSLVPSRSGSLEDWPYLDQEVLVSSRSRKVCLTCHWFRHQGASRQVV